MDILQRSSLFTDRDGERIHTDRATTEFVNDRLNDPFIHLVKSLLVDIKHGKSLRSGLLVDHSLRPHLGKVTHPAQEVVGDTRCTSRTSGYFVCPLLIDLHTEQSSRAQDDFCQFPRLIVIETAVHAEA